MVLVLLLGMAIVMALVVPLAVPLAMAMAMAVAKASPPRNNHAKWFCCIFFEHFNCFEAFL